MKQQTTYLSTFFVVCLCLLIGCAKDDAKECDLSSIHNDFMGIKWGEDFSKISKTILLTRTDFGGNDKEPGFQVVGGFPHEMENIPVTVYFQFANSKLSVVHVHADEESKNKLISTLKKKYGKPTAHSTNGIALWQDPISTIVLQEKTVKGGCLFSFTNNDTYMKVTGRTMRYY